MNGIKTVHCARCYVAGLEDCECGDPQPSTDPWGLRTRPKGVIGDKPLPRDETPPCDHPPCNGGMWGL